MTDPGDHGVRKSLKRQVARGGTWRTPPHECTNDAEIADRVDPEWRGNAYQPNECPGQSRTHGATDIDADAVSRDCWHEILRRHQVRNDRLPGRSGQRAT